MVFNYYGSAMVMFAASLGMSIDLLGGFGITTSSGFDGWLVAVGIPPFFGYLLDRSEIRGVLRSYGTMTFRTIRSMNVHQPQPPPWERVLFCGLPVVAYPWVAVGFSTFHWFTTSLPPGPNPYARFTAVCTGVAVVSLIFGLFTRAIRYVPITVQEGGDGGEGLPRPERAVWDIPAKALIGLNVALAAPFLALLFTV